MAEIFKRHLFPEGKEKYAKGNRPQVDCILCAVRDNDERVRSLKLHETDTHMIIMNLYPYNPGHLLIAPRKHITQFREISQKAWLEIKKLITLSTDAIGREFNTDSFNIGWNIGEFSGASIDHIHLHLIPRYRSELGFVDLISGSKIHVVKPEESLKRLKKYFTDRRG